MVCNECHRPDPSFITHEEAGPVLFSHERHARFDERWTCERCHHTDSPGEPHTACGQCHGTGHFAGIPTLKQAMERSCTGCHEDLKVGLTTWESMKSSTAEVDLFKYEDQSGTFWWDHRFHAVGAAFACSDCHHTLLKGDNSRIQSCRDCHGREGPVRGSPAEGTEAKSLEKAYQASCVECHVRLQGGPLTWEAFFKKEGSR
jgi:hypothetical protein